VSSNEGAKGFFKMNHLRSVSSEVALEVRLASCAQSNLQTPPWGCRTGEHPHAWWCLQSVPRGKPCRWEAAGRAHRVCSHTGECSVREVASLVRGNCRDELRCPGPYSAAI